MSIDAVVQSLRDLLLESNVRPEGVVITIDLKEDFRKHQIADRLAHEIQQRNDYSLQRLGSGIFRTKGMILELLGTPKPDSVKDGG